MRSRHEAIRAELEQEIRSGRLVVGSKLPTEQELCAAHGVSRTTAQRALNDLAAAGLVVRRRRSGTFVADARLQMDLMAFVDPSRAAAGIPGTHEVLGAGVSRAAAATIRLPGAADSAPVIEMARRKLDPDGRPRSLERHVLRFDVAPAMLEGDLEHLVTLRYLQAQGVEVAGIRVYVEPIVLTADDAALLEAEAGTAALVRRRELRAANGDVIEVVRTIARPGDAQFYVELPVPGARHEEGGAR